MIAENNYNPRMHHIKISFDFVSYSRLICRIKDIITTAKKMQLITMTIILLRFYRFSVSFEKISIMIGKLRVAFKYSIEKT